MAEEKIDKKNSSEEKKEINEEQPKAKVSFSLKKIIKNKNLPLYLLGTFSSIITFFLYSSSARTFFLDNNSFFLNLISSL